MHVPGVVVVGSTAGSVLRVAYDEHACVREALRAVVVDRDCGMADFAAGHDLEVRRFSGASNRELSDDLAGVLQELAPDLVLVFYTRLFEGGLLEQFSGRLLNFHPSLLPRHPGIGGFEQTVASGDELLGATVHLIEPGMDSGRVVLQNGARNDPEATLDDRRHLVFRMQVAQVALLCDALTDAGLGRALLPRTGA